jgi:hypothetical protein
MIRSSGVFVLASLLTSVLLGGDSAPVDPVLEVERSGASSRLWVKTAGERHLLRETKAGVTVEASGGDPSGKAFFATWDETGERWFAYSRDGGATWSSGRRLRRELRLVDGAVTPESPMPQPATEFKLHADGRLHVVQFKTTSLPEWRQALTEAGAEVLSYLPHNGHIVRADRETLAAIASLDFVERVEPYHPWYRLEPALRQSTRVERVRVVTFEWGPAGKQRVIEAAEALGAQVARYWPSGHVVELWVDSEQLHALAGHDDVSWIDRWSEPEQDMDLVREDAGTNYLENTYGYCGQGVRGEVMDGGIQDDHPDFDGIMLHGPFGLDSHGTATYGIVFGNGDRDGDGKGQGTGTMPCDTAQGIFADYTELTDRFVHTQELKNAPYYASFQTNSWGSSLTTAYNSYSSELDDIIFRLDIAITQSQSNAGSRSSRPQAWAKNIISVGGIRHYDTLDTSDDAWANGASIGPASDDRIKFFNDTATTEIYTTTTGSSYTSGFGGTSAATPETAGVLGLIVQMWADNVWETDPQGATVFEKQPHASTIKALLINTAQQYDFTGTTHDLTRVHQGWGRPSARTAHERAVKSLVVDEEVALALDELATYSIAVESGESELKVTMVYPDPPGTTSSTLHRINDVNLEVTSPSATVYHGNVGLDAETESTPGGSPNGVDTVENVFVRNPELGIWTVKVEAVEINQDGHLATPEDDATFALVVTGGTGLYTSAEGQVRFLRSEGACDETFPLRIRDGDTGSSTVTVEVRSDSETAPETVVLQETVSGSGNYTGEIPTTSGPVVPGDGILTALHGDILTVEYSDDGVPRQDNASVDCQAPVISQVVHSDITDVDATITWTTDEESDSWVSWDTAVPPLGVETRAGQSTTHTVRLTDLSECTTYYYSVASEDPVGNLSENDNGGAYFYFVTLKRTADELHSCREGRLILETDAVSCSGSVPVRLTDLDLNVDPGTVDTVTVSMTSSTETVPEPLLLFETGPDTATFTSSIPTGLAPAVEGDGVLQTADGDLVTGRHTDTDGGTGAPVNSFDTIVADCAGAAIGQVAVSNITQEDATVSWTTSEPTAGYVDWGPSPALGAQVASNTLKTNHSVSIGTFPECDRLYFRIVAADALDNTSVADTEGSPFEFNAAMVPGIFYLDDFELDAGWSLEGEWEIDEPLGLGSSPGDPTSAYSGSGVLGHDLSGLGAFLGDFEPTTTESATSPPIDASALSNAQLTFRRWLNVANGAIAYLQVTDGGGGWQTIWQSPGIGGFSESAWSEQSLNVSQYADGNSNFQVRFRQVSHIASAYDAGWNVDLLALRDGSQPPLDVCGGCGGSPVFGGLLAAGDDDPCADSGVTLTWSAAPAWGTGTTGSYVVYRDTSPGFTPGPGNLLAGGITEATWTDPSPPSDVTLYYLVRAENDETCGSGPNNNGLTDANLVYGVARNATSQAPPGDVGASLRVSHVNLAHARLSWSELPDAAAYRIYRSDTPQAVVGLEAETGEALFEDADVFADGQSWYYLVDAVDACGNEGL